MKTVSVKITGKSPLSFSKYVQTPKLEREGHADYDERTWRERLHYDSNGVVFVPPMMFKNALSEAAKYRSEQIQGKGKSTYTKHFEAGVMATQPMSLGINKDDVQKEVVHVPADGKRGGTTRVLKNFPKIENWSGIINFHILDEIITRDVFERHLKDAGDFIGIGRFRPRNNGYYGRFDIEIVDWK
jgi:hypothetical protein